MTPPRIVIHIGANKTGSTFLQRLLRSEPELWRSHGIYVPVLPEVEGIAGNAKLLAAALGGENPAFRRRFPHIEVSSLDPAELVARMLAGWQPERELLLLSAENFSRRSPAEPLRALLPRDVATTVVLFVRNQIDWIESYHRQQVKLGLLEGDLPGLVGGVIAGEERRHCADWLDLYRAWCDAFGDCRVVVFEEAAADLFGAFSTAAGLPATPSVPPLERQNVSPDGYQIAYLLELADLEFPELMRRRTAARLAAERSPAPMLRYLSDEDSERLRARFETGNRELLEILGRPYEGSPLDLSGRRSSAVRLDDVYRSRPYRSYRRLADAIHAGSS